LIIKETEIARKFKTMFQNLLNKTIDESQINTGYMSVEPEDKESSLEEIAKKILAKEMLKNNRAARNNDIASELIILML